MNPIAREWVASGGGNNNSNGLNGGGGGANGNAPSGISGMELLSSEFWILQKQLN